VEDLGKIGRFTTNSTYGFVGGYKSLAILIRVVRLSFVWSLFNSLTTATFVRYRYYGLIANC